MEALSVLHHITTHSLAYFTEQYSTYDTTTRAQPHTLIYKTKQHKQLHRSHLSRMKKVKKQMSDTVQLQLFIFLNSHDKWAGMEILAKNCYTVLYSYSVRPD